MRRSSLVRYRRDGRPDGPSDDDRATRRARRPTAASRPRHRSALGGPDLRSRSRSWRSSVWFVRSIPRTLALTAIASLFAFALNPWSKRCAGAPDGSAATRRPRCWSRTGVIAITTIVLVTVPTIRPGARVQQAGPEDRQGARDPPDHRPKLREANASKKVRQWINDFPKRLDANSKPIAKRPARSPTASRPSLFALLLAITLVLDGERLVRRAGGSSPTRRRADADRLGRLVYDVVGRYIAGTLFMAALAGVVMLAASLVARRSPRAVARPCGWRSPTRSPRSAGSSARSCSSRSALTQGAVVGVIASVVFLIYQQIENHVLQPLIIGRAVRLSPPATMVAALVGVAAAGLIGGLFAIPAARREQGDLPRCATRARAIPTHADCDTPWTPAPLTPSSTR